MSPGCNYKYLYKRAAEGDLPSEEEKQCDDEVRLE